MKQILVYGDSLSWGIIPGTRRRFDFDARWPGVLENKLRDNGIPTRVIENCLNGRRTVWEDPFKPGRNGAIGLAQAIESSSPLALVMIMLGTNDFQSIHTGNVWHSAQGMATLISTIRQAPIEPGMPIPPLFIVAPPPIQPPKGNMEHKFGGADKKCTGLAREYLSLCNDSGCHFFDAGQIISTSPTDGVHLDAAQHLTLGQSLASVVAPLIS